MDSFEIELKQDFLNESEDLLVNAENAFLRLESERSNPELLNEIFRLAHNLKGTSKAVGFDQLAELTHVAENLILKLKEGSLQASDSIVSTLLEFKDKINEMVNGLKHNLNANFDIALLKKKIEAEIAGKSLNIVATDGESIPTETAFEPESKVIASENVPVTPEIQINSAALDSLKEIGLDLPGNCQPLETAPLEEKTVTTQANAKTQQPSENEESIRVKLSRIDKINDVIGELVILQTVIHQRRFEFIQDDLSNKSIGMMGKLFKEVQELAMSLRLLPLKPTFQKMTRIVRDTSKLLGKEINLNLIGEDTEVDKTVLEKIADPLVHTVRNAVDHGIEMPDERVAKGKDKKGNVELYAYHEGSNLVIQVTDDGKGIDSEVIRKKAIEKNIIKSNSNLSDHELRLLIFHPGFSTKEKVTEVSGRGVGMDVVKTNVEALGGEVKLMSKVGQGSTLKIILPLTLAVIQGIVIKAEKEKFVLPLTQVFEISRVKTQDVESFSGIASLFRLRGEVLPLFFINKKIGKKVDTTLNAYTVIIVRGLHYAFGVAVDDILNQQQIVIKPIGDDIKGKKGIIGSAIMADGMPSFILDLYELFKDDIKESKGHQKFRERNIKVA
ncbi:MAG: chemotaxis protein CheA [Bacteriovoracaceae bacterium]